MGTVDREEELFRTYMQINQWLDAFMLAITISVVLICFFLHPELF